jgi:hypothetical protein
MIRPLQMAFQSGSDQGGLALGLLHSQASPRSRDLRDLYSNCPGWTPLSNDISYTFRHRWGNGAGMRSAVIGARRGFPGWGGANGRAWVVRRAMKKMDVHPFPKMSDDAQFRARPVLFRNCYATFSFGVLAAGVLRTALAAPSMVSYRRTTMGRFEGLESASVGGEDHEPKAKADQHPHQ